MSDTRLPVVSVIIPAFRAAKYIGQALGSVLAQTFTRYEIIVVNDASPDSEELEEVLKRFGDRVTHVKHAMNQGPGAARNTGILAARGEYLAFLDADDYWVPAFLAEQMAFLGQHPDVSLVYSDARLVVDGSHEITGRWMDSNPSRGEPTCEALLRQDCTVATSSVVVRRQAVLDAGLFDPAIGNYSEDFDLYVRLAKSGARLAYQRTPLMYRRIHPGSLTAETENLRRGALKVLRKTAERQDLTQAERASLTRTSGKLMADVNLEQARVALGAGDFARALELVRAAHAFYRTWKLKAIMLALWLFPALLLRAARLRALALTRRGRRATSHSPA